MALRSPSRLALAVLLTSGCFALSAACGGAKPAPETKPDGPQMRGAGESGKTDKLETVDMSTPWRDAKTLEAMCDQALKEAEGHKAKMTEGETRTVANTLGPYNDISLALDTPGGWAGLMASVHPEEPVRKVALDCQQRVAKFANELKQDRAVYDALDGLDEGGLTAEERRVVDRALREFRRAGVDKDEATRKRLADIHAEMVKLGQEYRKNVREDVRFIEFEDSSALKGLPDDYVKAHPKGESGKHRITTDYPDFFPFQTYSPNAELREKLYREFMRRGYPKNTEILASLLKLRQEYVSILGYPTWAQYQAEDKMAKSQARIDEFLDSLAKIARPRAEEDLADLLAAKRKEDPKAKRIETWDRFYYTSKVQEAKHDFDARSVRPYFPYEKVKDGIFALYGELFGLRFEPLEGAEVWHPSVDKFAVYRGDALAGHVYLDMHPREGKFKHAAMYGTQVGLKSADRLPFGTLVCNFPEPRGEDAGLMEHSQVVTFFHEFGHLIHHLMARADRYMDLSGLNMEWDFVEAPSQLLEEWAWDPDVLRRFAHHHETGEPIPAELVQKMKAADEFGKGAAVMRQLFYANYSFRVHTRDPKTLDLEKYTNEIYDTYSPYPRIEGGYVYANFGHLIGYSSMYYTYQWSLVIAKDLFTRFADKGLLDPEVAREYRDKVLAAAGTKDAAEMVKDFLGRESNLEAYKKWLTE